MRKSEKLAREIVGLLLKYSRDDFDSAIQLIESGNLLDEQIKYFKRAASLKKTERRASKTTPKKTIVYEDVRNVGSQLPPEEFDVFDGIFRGIWDGKYFLTKEQLLGFAKISGVNASASAVTRKELTKKLAVHLVALTPEERKNFYDRANRSSESQSSLLQWSDIIVKK